VLIEADAELAEDIVGFRGRREVRGEGMGRKAKATQHHQL
jgi:hypothetical protein